MMEKTTEIEKYIVFLITKCDLSVTLHPLEPENLITFSRLGRFNIHDNSYCTCVKSTKQGKARCAHQQRRVLERCRAGSGAFCGICHAGVFEYVYPIFDGRREVGFISVSGYSCERGRERVAPTAAALGGAAAQFLEAYDTLRPSPPDSERIDTLILPLCRMLELAYRTAGERSEESLVTRICRYVHENYTKDLTTEEICRVFYCSRSYISHRFKQETGKSFREYLTEVRLANAKRLLHYSSLRVTEIALSVGFNNANYFSNTFRTVEGLSPLAYRKRFFGR